MPDESAGIMNLFKFKNSIGPERIEQPEPGSHPPCFVNPSGEADTVARTDRGGRWTQIGFVELIEGDFVWVSMVTPAVTVPAFPAAAKERMPDMKHSGPWRLVEEGEIAVLDANNDRIILWTAEGLQFADQEVERLVLAAPYSFALVVEFLCTILPQLQGTAPPAEFSDFGVRCRHLVTRVLAQPAQPAGRPSYEELAATLKRVQEHGLADGIYHDADEPLRTEISAIIARIEQKPHEGEEI
jgi:hypothetical protein